MGTTQNISIHVLRYVNASSFTTNFNVLSKCLGIGHIAIPNIKLKNISTPISIVLNL